MEQCLPRTTTRSSNHNHNHNHNNNSTTTTSNRKPPLPKYTRFLGRVLLLVALVAALFCILQTSLLRGVIVINLCDEEQVVQSQLRGMASSYSFWWSSTASTSDTNSAQDENEIEDLEGPVSLLSLPTTTRTALTHEAAEELAAEEAAQQEEAARQEETKLEEAADEAQEAEEEGEEDAVAGKKGETDEDEDDDEPVQLSVARNVAVTHTAPPPPLEQITCTQLFQGPLLLVWAYDDPPNIYRLQTSLARIPAHVETIVFCGSTVCMRRVQPTTPCLRVVRLVVQPLAQGTVLQGWTTEHALAKLLAAHHYEDQLQVAMQLAALYQYGGAVVHLLQTAVYEELLLEAAAAAVVVVGNSTEQQQKQLNNQPPPLQVIQYQSSVLSPQGGLWGVAAPAKSAAVEEIMQGIVRAYAWDETPVVERFSKDHWPVQVHFDAIFSNNHGVVQTIATRNVMEPTAATPSDHSFATLSYDARHTYLQSQGNPGMNLGDEMQGLAGIQFIPRLDAFIERDRLDVVRFTKTDQVNGIQITPKTPPVQLSSKVYAFLNGWFGTKDMVWPPPAFVEPITVAMHFSPGMYDKVLASHESREFFQKNAPIGARDSKTLSFLKNMAHVDAFFTACMTMSFSLPPLEQRSGGVLIVDVTNVNKLQAVVPESVLANATYLTHKVTGDMANDNLLRHALAYEKLLQYRAATLVVTERLHTALPAIAMGTPVVFLDSDTLVGGDASRLEGLQKFMHFVPKNKFALSPSFDWTFPPANPFRVSFERYANTIKHVAACHAGISDSARKFGLVPDTWTAADDVEVCGEYAAVTSPTAIHVAAVVDDNFLYEVFPSWLQALSRSNKQEDLVLYILTFQLSSKQRCLVRHLTNKYMPKTIVYTVPVDFLKHKAKNYKGLMHVSLATQARLYLGSLLPCVSKVIWMDLDAFAVASLRHLWDLPIPACGICGRSSVIHFLDAYEKRLGFKWSSSGFGYGFNAGVMLISLDTLRARNFETELVPYWGEELGLNDQIVYNLACNGTQGSLRPKYNVFQDYPNHTPPRKYWVIAHFQSSKKPWKVFTEPKRRRTQLEQAFYQIWWNNKLTFENAIAVENMPPPLIKSSSATLTQ